MSPVHDINYWRLEVPDGFDWTDPEQVEALIEALAVTYNYSADRVARRRGQARDRCALATRFYEQVEKTPDCWLWKCPRPETGYGQFRIRDRTWGAHQISFVLAWHYDHVLMWGEGGILRRLSYNPDGSRRDICHQCPNGANRHCVRPSHLRRDTHANNMREIPGSRRGRRGKQ